MNVVATINAGVASSTLSMGVLFLASLLISLLCTGWLIKWLRAQNILVLPDYRSLHKTPVPMGAGWIIIILACLALPVFQKSFSDPAQGALWVGTIGLATLSWYDDRHKSSVGVRLFLQIFAIGAVLYFTPERYIVFGGYLPFWADRAIAAICWLWFVNLFNFMDGIDGICGIEVLQICIGLSIVFTITGFFTDNLPVLSIIAGATIGFLRWNWHPARIFMGDVGSITLGYILGWQLLQLASAGYLAAALIIPLYYLIDATFTLFWRIGKKQKFWHPHKCHFYQQAAEITNDHSVVVIGIALLNSVLLFLAIWSIWHPVPAMGVAVFVTSAAIFSIVVFDYALLKKLMGKGKIIKARKSDYGDRSL